MITTYNDVTKSPTIIHTKYKDIFTFLEWKMSHYPTHFNSDDQDIVNGKMYSRLFDLSEKSCTYFKEMMNRYTETRLWKSSLKNQFQLEGYPIAPNPSCDTLPIPPGTSRKSEILLMSMLYKNNLLQDSLYKLGKVPSPMCSLCGLEEETAPHILFSCILCE